MQTEAEVIAELRAVLQECREAANRDLEAKREAEREVGRLRAALARYRHCRHASLDCFCTAEARAALEGKLE